MSLEQIRAILQSGKASTPLPEFHELAAHFEEFVELYSRRKDALKNPAEASSYLKKLNETQQKVQQSFEKTCNALGMTVEQFRDYLENPNHFAPEQWATLEEIKRQSLAFIESPAAPKTKKQRRRHLKAASKI